LISIDNHGFGQLKERQYLRSCPKWNAFENLDPEMRKMEAKRILFIPQIRKIEAEQTLFIPQIGKIEAKRSLFIQELKKIEAKQTQLKKNELDGSKTNRGSIFKIFMEPRNRFQGIDSASLCNGGPELVFLNLYGAQESMPRHQFRQPM
jgi:hypothetical protein